MGVTVGKISEDLVSQVLGTGYCQFQSPFGIDGLCKFNGKRLDILAVAARDPGTGQFRRFIEAAKQEFDEINVWDIMNSTLGETLARYGFKPVTEQDPDCAERIEGMRWLGGR